MDGATGPRCRKRRWLGLQPRSPCTCQPSQSTAAMGNVAHGHGRRRRSVAHVSVHELMSLPHSGEPAGWAGADRSCGAAGLWVGPAVPFCGFLSTRDPFASAAALGGIADGVASNHDALRAVVPLATAVQIPAEAGDLPPEKALASLLLVIRDYVEPVAVASADSEAVERLSQTSLRSSPSCPDPVGAHRRGWVLPGGPVTFKTEHASHNLGCPSHGLSSPTNRGDGRTRRPRQQLQQAQEGWLTGPAALP